MGVLESPRDVHHPGPVTEMPADLSEDRWRREARKRRPAIGIKPIDGLDETDRADLDQVVEGLAPVGIPTCQRFDQGHVIHDERITVRRIGSWAGR